jgi:hypothetical protein
MPVYIGRSPSPSLSQAASSRAVCRPWWCHAGPSSALHGRTGSTVVVVPCRRRLCRQPSIDGLRRENLTLLGSQEAPAQPYRPTRAGPGGFRRYLLSDCSAIEAHRRPPRSRFDQLVTKTHTPVRTPHTEHLFDPAPFHVEHHPPDRTVPAPDPRSGRRRVGTRVRSVARGRSVSHGWRFPPKGPALVIMWGLVSLGWFGAGAFLVCCWGRSVGGNW